MNQINVLSEQRNHSSVDQNSDINKLIQQFQSKIETEKPRIPDHNYQITKKYEEQFVLKTQNVQNQAIKCQNWSREDSSRLFQYHAIYGNKWARISTLFGDRSDNSVKNHFYSTLRKAHRIINKFIKQQRKKIAYRLLKDNILSKVICLSQKSFSSDYPDELIQKSKSLLNKLVVITQSLNDEVNLSFMMEIINDLLLIHKGFKHKKINKRKGRSQLNQTKIETSQKINIVSSKRQRKQLLNTTSNQKVQQNIKQGFQLYSSSLLDTKTQELPNSNSYFNQFIPLMSNYYLPYNNLPQFAITQQQGCSSQIYIDFHNRMYQILSPPLMNYY